MSIPSPGRRVAAPPRRLNGGAAAAAVLVALAAALVLLTGAGNDAGEDGDRATGVPVDRAVTGCPRFAPPRGTSTTLAIGSAPLDGLGSSGSLRYGAPGAAVASAPAQDVTRGELLGLDATADDPEALAVDAAGALAAGLFTFQADIGRGGTAAVTECPAPRASWWFTGAGATLDHTSELVLSNVDPGPAVVDVRVLGPEGPVETLGTRGITIPPSGRTTLSLTDIAPQGEELAVSVVASRGRVVAGLSDDFAPEFGAATGTEWVPPQRSASRVVRLAGLPGRADNHTLVLANPSELEALVELEVSSQTGSFAPTDGAQVRVPPGSVVTSDISEPVGRKASAVTLRSPVPVTATVRSVTDGDTSYAGSVRVLTGPAAAPLPEGVEATLQLTAGERPATATVTAYRRDGRQTETATVEVDPGATTTWSPGARADYLLVTPQDGQVLGAVSYGGGAGSSQVALHPLTVRVEQPAVRPVLR